jgi:hypothetical protein
MSFVTCDFVPAGRETRTSIPVTAENCFREEEFRHALDKYIAAYAAHQTRRSEAIASAASAWFIHHNLKKFAGWVSLLRVAREVWLFSRGVGTDWRQPSRH